MRGDTIKNGELINVGPTRRIPARKKGALFHFCLNKLSPRARETKIIDIINALMERSAIVGLLGPCLLSKELSFVISNDVYCLMELLHVV